MKKLFLFLFGLLLFAGSFASFPSSEVDFDTGIYIEQPQDFEVIVDESATILKIDFVKEAPKLEGWTDDYSLNSNRYEYLFMEADLAFNSEYTNEINYFYRGIELRNRPPNTEAKTLLSTNDYTNTSDGFINAMHKNIFGFWLC